MDFYYLKFKAKGLTMSNKKEGVQKVRNLSFP